MSELQPCPFCGGDGEVQCGASCRFWVQCKDGCDVCPHTRLFDTKQEAVDVWNRRVGE